MNTKESLELVYLRLIADLKLHTDGSESRRDGRHCTNIELTLEILQALGKIQDLREWEEDWEDDRKDLSDLMRQVPAPGSEQA